MSFIMTYTTTLKNGLEVTVLSRAVNQPFWVKLEGERVAEGSFGKNAMPEFSSSALNEDEESAVRGYVVRVLVDCD